MRVGQIAAAGPSDANYRFSVERALAYFDQATAIRCGVARLARLTDQAMTGAVDQAHAALKTRDPQLIRVAADHLGGFAEAGGEVVAARAALIAASAVVAKSATGALLEGQQP